MADNQQFGRFGRVFLSGEDEKMDFFSPGPTLNKKLRIIHHYPFPHNQPILKRYPMLPASKAAQDLESMLQANRKEFDLDYDTLHWIRPEQVLAAEERRRELLTRLAGSVGSCCGGAKLFTRDLSPGCRLCTEGLWSCLFINGICNGRCFYCPADQTRKGEPTTNTLQFPVVRDFVEYLAVFGIRGVGFSGGEPLMTLDRTLSYLGAVKKRFGNSVHAWMYTNGMLLTEDILMRLKDAGLDEIRFDISADRYSLAKVALAVGEITTVTIEIPAVPEDRQILQQAMLEMNDLGVNHLNLHQLRLTPFNRHNLAPRPYTFLHGPKVTVLESEQAALEMLGFALDKGFATGVNYCSFIYRHRYQTLGSRRRATTLLGKAYESVTGTGHLRNLMVFGDPGRLEDLAASFTASGHSPSLWSLNGQKTRLTIHESLLPLVNQEQFSFKVTYHTAAIKSSISYQNSYREVALGKKRKVVVERRAATGEIHLDNEALHALREGHATSEGAAAWQDISDYEEPGSGLLAYF
nr:radical SAM protein [Desulfobulbaceae bacterium]